MSLMCSVHSNNKSQSPSFDLREVYSKNSFNSSSFWNTNMSNESFLAHCFGFTGHFSPFIIEFLAAALSFPHGSMNMYSTGKIRVIAWG